MREVDDFRGLVEWFFRKFEAEAAHYCNIEMQMRARRCSV